MNEPAKSEDLVVRRIEQGTVIDHITHGQGLRVLEFLGILDDPQKWGQVALVMGVESLKEVKRAKDIVKVANRILTPEEISLVALIAPNTTINSIENYKVVNKYQVRLPDKFQGTEGITCPNPLCVTNHEEGVLSEFQVESRESPAKVRCSFCERLFSPEQLVNPRKRKE
ncbi:MAG: aspartate carbamoyltransferase regulatory subunit [Candidatus Thorarchaeota archaeon]